MSGAPPKVAVAAALLAAVLLAAAAPARAHDRGSSRCHVRATADGAHVRLGIRSVERARLAASGRGVEAIARGVVQSVHVLGPGCRDAALETVRELETVGGFATFEWRVRCGGPARGVAMPVGVLDPAHVFFARFEALDGAVDEAVLTERAPALVATRGEAARVGEEQGPIARLLPVGLWHVLGGADHLAFLFLLILGARSLADVGALVTAFTLGHAGSAALVVLGGVVADAGLVEALIGYSVALVALETAWVGGGARDRGLAAVAVLVPLGVALLTGAFAWIGVALFAGCHLALVARGSTSSAAAPQRHAPAARALAPAPARTRRASPAWSALVVVLFGLVHGFGFGGALVEDGGYAPGDALFALVGFNLGIELGQLALVALAFPVLAFARRRGLLGGRAPLYASALGLSLGVFWLTSRLA